MGIYSRQRGLSVIIYSKQDLEMEFAAKFNYYMQHDINKLFFMKMNTTDHRY